jgi:hypothetical protein
VLRNGFTIEKIDESSMRNVSMKRQQDQSWNKFLRILRTAKLLNIQYCGVFSIADSGMIAYCSDPTISEVEATKVGDLYECNIRMKSEKPVLVSTNPDHFDTLPHKDKFWEEIPKPCAKRSVSAATTRRNSKQKLEPVIAQHEPVVAQSQPVIAQIPSEVHGSELLTLYPNGGWVQDGKGFTYFIDGDCLWVEASPGSYVCTMNGASLKPYVTSIADPYNIDLSCLGREDSQDVSWMLSDLNFEDILKLSPMSAENSLPAQVPISTEVKSTTINCPPPPPPDENPNHEISSAEENDIDYNAEQEGVEWNDMRTLN